MDSQSPLKFKQTLPETCGGTKLGPHLLKHVPLVPGPSQLEEPRQNTSQGFSRRGSQRQRVWGQRNSSCRLAAIVRPGWVVIKRVAGKGIKGQVLCKRVGDRGGGGSCRGKPWFFPTILPWSCQSLPSSMLPSVCSKTPPNECELENLLYFQRYS